MKSLIMRCRLKKILRQMLSFELSCLKYSVPGSYSRDMKMCNKEKPRQEGGMVLFIDLSVGNHIMPKYVSTYFRALKLS